MGDDAVIIEGARDGDAEMQKASMYSSVHGGRRVMSRTEARESERAGREGADRVAREGELGDGEAVARSQGVDLARGGLDEAPQAYRRLPEVLSAQGATIRVLHDAATNHRGDGGRTKFGSIQGLVLSLSAEPMDLLV